MRALRPSILPLIALAPGCLASPEGAPQTWPPPGLDDLDVVDVTAAEVDAEGQVFLLRGGVDVVADSDAPLVSFSRLASVGPIDGPARVLVTELDASRAGQEVVVASVGADGPTLAVLDAALAPIVTHALPPALVQGPGVATMTLARLGVGGEDRLYLSIGGQIVLLPSAEALAAEPALLMLPPPVASWPPITTLALSPPGAAPARLVVGGDVDAWSAPLPLGPTPSWVVLRDEADAWEASVVAPIAGDGADGVLLGRAPRGVDGDALCAVPLDATVTPACLDLARDRNGRGFVRVADFGLAAGPDALVVVGGPVPAVTVYPQVTLTGGALTAGAAYDPPSPPPEVAGAIPALADVGGDAAPELLLVGASGDAACLSLGMPLLAPCEP